MSTITQAEFDHLVESHYRTHINCTPETALEHLTLLIETAGITVEEPPYVPSKPGEVFTDSSGDIWEVSNLNRDRAHPLDGSSTIEFILEHYGPLKPYTPHTPHTEGA